jgi:hypothetical protein
MITNAHLNLALSGVQYKMASGRCSSGRKAARGSLFLFSCVAAAFLFASPAMAADAQPGAQAQSLGHWLIQFAAVMMIANAMVGIYAALRPTPPNHRAYAPINHDHPGLVSKPDQKLCRDDQAREIMSIRTEMGGMTGKVERQIDHLRNAITTQNQQMISAIKELDEKQDDRIRRMHARLDPLPAAIAANTRSIETHLADHRAGKAV